MLASAIIVFREVLEAALIAGIVLAATRGVPGRGRWVAAGIVGGLAGACIIAAFADVIAGAVEGAGQEILNASILLFAVVLLGWHNVWMGRHARELSAQMKAVGQAVSDGKRPMHALSIVVGAAVLREGAEVVLFLNGMASGAPASQVIGGGAIGLASGAIMGGLLYAGLLRIPPRRLFAVTGGLILLLAAGLSAQAVQLLYQAGLLPSLGGVLWDTSNILAMTSLPGQMLHTLIGYDDHPSALQLAAYLTTLTVIGGAMVLLRRRDNATA